MKNDSYALHSITGHATVEFNPDHYSRFKFGDGELARQFGQALARGFVSQQLTHLSADAQLVVLPSPYAFIPTASYWLAQAFLRELNRSLVAHDRPVAHEVKISRSITYRDDYGNLTLEERIRLIGKDSFRVDAAALTGKTLLFVDDIRITGSHQLVVERMLRQYELTNPSVFIYYGQLTNPDVHPNIENYFNYYTVKSLADLTSIIGSPQFRMNTRLVKFILNHQPADAHPFLAQQTESFLNELYDMALGNEYHLIAEYEPTLTTLAQLLSVNHYQEL